MSRHAGWLCGSSRRAVPLSKIQREILRLLAAQRSLESYVAGLTPLHRDGPRFSGDIDIFHDREEQVAIAAARDAESLIKAGFALAWLRQEPGLHAAEIRHGDEATKLEWARDSDFRFYPAIADELFGYMLHLVDIITNKALAAAGRNVPRDALDLLYIHEQHLPLGAVIWAAVGKDPDYSPENLIAEIRRNARYRAEDYDALALVAPVDAGDVLRRLRAGLDEAEALVQAMPAGKEGLIFLENGKPVRPDPERLDRYVALAGARQGLWPSSSEIGSAMLERYGKPPL
jgi:hypothetical protein